MAPKRTFPKTPSPHPLPQAHRACLNHGKNSCIFCPQICALKNLQIPFYFLAAPRNKWLLGSLTSDQTHTPWSGSAESKLLDHQGSKNIHQTTEYPPKHQGTHIKLSRRPVKITVTRFDLWDKQPPPIFPKA